MKTFKGCSLILICVVLWGCSSANDTQITLDVSGKHPAGWAVATIGGQHPAAFLANQAACAECHGSAQNKAQSGGISGVSCFSTSRSGIACHPTGPSGHPVGWSAPGSHGSAAKAAAPGLSYCTGCHGTSFTGGTGKSCMTCHTTAPHPAAPWRGTTATGTTHTTTNQTNAVECARCHLNNQRLLTPLAVPAGTNPGCFNSTLCHGPISGHPAGWSAPGSHGSAAKATPGTSQGLAYCTQCHGSDFISGSGTSCKTCHTNAPHPLAPWRGTTASGTTHTTTDQGNVSQCARCHLNNQRLATPVAVPTGTTPGCFNGTLCHSSGGGGHGGAPYPGHVAAAVTAGVPFASCKVCHTATNRTYPNGTNPNYLPPDCQGCHTKLAPTGVATNCHSCHGSATATGNNIGRPVGTAFPDKIAQHNKHNGLACALCHSGGGSGTAAHGNSNRVVKTVSDVHVQLSGEATAISLTRNGTTFTCTGTCHGESHSTRTW